MLDLNEMDIKLRLFMNEFDLSLGHDFEKRWYRFISYLRLFCFEEYVNFIGERPDNHLTFSNSYHARIFYGYANGLIKRAMRRNGSLHIKKTIWTNEEEEYDNEMMLYNGELITIESISNIIKQNIEDIEKDKNYILETLLGLVIAIIITNVIANNGSQTIINIQEKLMVDYKDIIAQTNALNGLNPPNYNILPISSNGINKPVPLPLPNDKPNNRPLPFRDYPEALTAEQAYEEYKMTNNSLNGYPGNYDKGVMEKEWITTGDERVRLTHQDIDGEIVAIDEKFGNGLMYPHDPMGSSQEVDGCRCSLEFYGTNGETIYE